MNKPRPFTTSTASLPGPTEPGQRSVAPFGPRWVPAGYTGLVALPGTGRVIWWTGRVAIGLRYGERAAA